MLLDHGGEVTGQGPEVLNRPLNWRRNTWADADWLDWKVPWNQRLRGGDNRQTPLDGETTIGMFVCASVFGAQRKKTDNMSRTPTPSFSLCCSYFWCVSHYVFFHIFSKQNILGTNPQVKFSSSLLRSVSNPDKVKMSWSSCCCTFSCRFHNLSLNHF